MINKDSKIFIAGHNSLDDSAIYDLLKKKKFNKILIVNKKKLDLRNSNKVFDFFKKNKIEFVIICAAKVGGIMANSTYPTEFLIENIEIQNNIQKKYIENNLESFKTGFSLNESLLELKPLVHRINKLINKKESEDLVKYNKKDFKKIFDKISNLYQDKKIFIVYLPETTCFKHRSKECKIRFDELKNLSNEITFLNFYEFINKNIDDYKKMYALGQDRAHFSNLGYKYLVEFVNNSIEND